ncbi:helix-turn-helix transcriptional regulator [Subtercola boreus]|uniref:helix-turn-helix transcriptional regulator n=1 Tax=Subtercola boreus TaxID=120213 RepID=UPI0011C07212|nr:helix-turn-helix transcriptional regulator [Subtercola boreus]
MAIEYSRTPIGTRLAFYRKMAGFRTPQALADAIPSSAITRSTVVNIEVGRKKDPSYSEVMLIASALDISPLALMVDFENPWSPIDVEGMARPYGGVTSVEYVSMVQVLQSEYFRNPPDTFWGLGRLMDSLHGAEAAEADVAAVAESVARGDKWEKHGTHWRLELGEKSVNIVLSDLDVDSPEKADHAAVEIEYQDLLQTIAFFDNVVEKKPHLNLPDSVWNRVNHIGDVVEEYSREVPIPNANVKRKPWAGPSLTMPRLKHQSHLKLLFDFGTPETRRSAVGAFSEHRSDFYDMNLYNTEGLYSLGLVDEEETVGDVPAIPSDATAPVSGEIGDEPGNG